MNGMALGAMLFAVPFLVCFRSCTVMTGWLNDSLGVRGTITSNRSRRTTIPSQHHHMRLNYARGASMIRISNTNNCITWLALPRFGDFKLDFKFANDAIYRCPRATPAQSFRSPGLHTSMQVATVPLQAACKQSDGRPHAPMKARNGMDSPNNLAQRAHRAYPRAELITRTSNAFIRCATGLPIC